MKIFPCFPIFAALVAVVAAVPSGSSAEEPRIGRLQDGRAYRIENGFQLVDHIAELEVTVDELRQQLAASESTGMPIAKSVNSSCANETTGLREKIARLEQGLAQCSAARQSTGMDNCESIASPLRQQISALKTSLEAAPRADQLFSEQRRSSSLVSELAGRDKQVNGLSQQLVDTREQLAAAQVQLVAKDDLIRALESDDKTNARRLSALEQQLVETEAVAKRNKTLEQELTLARAQLQARASLARHIDSGEPEASAVEVSEQPRQSYQAVENDDATLRQSKSEFQRTLSGIQGLILQRKNLYDALKGAGKGVSVQIGPPAAGDGRSLDKVRLEVANLNRSSDLDSIALALSQIQRQLADDVSVIRRLVQ